MNIVSADKMTLVAKINETKKRLANAELKKSGRNTFQKYEYFELGDFLPTIIAAESELGFLNVISITPDIATLTVIDADSEKTITFTSPIADAATKGASPIQAVGSMHTYMRRYLYVMAYEIAEHDAIDGLDQADKAKEIAWQKKPQRPEPTKQENMPDEKTAIMVKIRSLIYPDYKSKDDQGEADPAVKEIYERELKAHMSLHKDIKKFSDLNINQLKDMLQKMDLPEVLR